MNVRIRKSSLLAEKMVGDSGSVCGGTCIVQMNGGKGNDIEILFSKRNEN
jgi:hypothetical protein